MIRRWWNRWLIRLRLVHSEWYRATYDATTGLHESFRLRKGADHMDSDAWLSTRLWHDDAPTDVMDRASFHIWPEPGGWRFGPTPERTVLSASFSGDHDEVDMRVAVTADDWSIATPDVLGAATWPYALTDAEVEEANAAMTDVEIQEVDQAIVEAGNVHLELQPATPGPWVTGQRWTPGGTVDQRVLPDDSRGILVTDLREGDGPYVPTTMPTDQIPLPQDFNYPEPAINLDEGRVWRGGFSHDDGRYLALPDTTEAADTTEAG